MTRKYILPLLLSALLSACAVGGASLATAIPPAPIVVADRTMIDERAALGVELAYQAAALSLRTAIRADLLSPAARAHAQSAEAKAYLAVTAARAAYDTGNAASYPVAIAQAQQAVAALQSILK